MPTPNASMVGLLGNTTKHLCYAMGYDGVRTSHEVCARVNRLRVTSMWMGRTGLYLQSGKQDRLSIYVSLSYSRLLVFLCGAPDHAVIVSDASLVSDNQNRSQT